MRTQCRFDGHQTRMCQLWFASSANAKNKYPSIPPMAASPKMRSPTLDRGCTPTVNITRYTKKILFHGRRSKLGLLDAIRRTGTPNIQCRSLQIMRARLRHRSCGATLRRSRSPRRDPVFRDTANPIRDTASDPNGTLAPKFDYITNKLTNVHRKLDSITERLDEWDAHWAQDEKEDEKTTK